MNPKNLISYIISDINRYKVEDNKSTLKVVLTSPGLWVTINCRLRRYFIYSFKMPIFKQLINFILTITSFILKFMTCIELSPQTEIGRGLYMPHLGYIIINSNTKIGDNCTILQGVTIGNNANNNQAVPEIGSNVYIGAGAVIMGKIKIGNNVAIGANSVVNKNVEDNLTVAGVPAKIISTNGSVNLIKY